ncbi:hypothetical protein [Capnocytophaga cynodegmi]|uniref:hypothetical protein n=1 Tax=Capnocytophaga cynodegmi TaxID=28189 RepID=UPI0038597045
MRIISQFKDFYDWKVAEYGIDETLIFDRRDPVLLIKNGLLVNNNIFKEPTDTDALHSVLYVGNELVHIFSTKSHIYTHFDLENVTDLDAYSDYFLGSDDFKLKNGKNITITSYLYTQNNYSLYEQFHQSRTKNIYGVKDIVTHSGHKLQWEDFAQKPLLLLRRLWHNSSILLDSNPFLAQAGIYIDADFVWQNIVQFLSDLKSQTEKSPEVPNEQKIENKGFDKKTSFRPKMKKR